MTKNQRDKITKRRRMAKQRFLLQQTAMFCRVAVRRKGPGGHYRILVRP